MRRSESSWAAFAFAALTVAISPTMVLAQTPAPTADVRVKAAQGKTVRVTATDAVKRTGRLVSLTDAAVVIHTDAKDLSIPLASVRRVERVAHGVRNGFIVGAVAGFIYGFGVTEEDGQGSGREVLGGSIIGAMGGAGGAGIGALFNRARRDRNLVYERRSPSTSVITPILFPAGRPGLGIAVTW